MSRLQRGLSSLNGAASAGGGTRMGMSLPGGGDRQGTKSFEELKRLIHANWSTSSTCRASAILKATHCAARFAWSSNVCATRKTHCPNRMERERLIDEVLDETFGFGPLEVLLKDPDDQRHSHQRSEEDLRRTPRQDGEERRHLPRQRASDADHRPHRVEGRPARR